MSAALGFGWLVWRRGRWAYAFALASALLTYVIGQTPLAPYALACGGVYFALAVLAMLATLSFADSTDISSVASGYPKHLFLLPVRSVALAAWPMLLGSLALVSAWVAFAATALAPRFGPVAVVLPALGLVALLAGLQAISWTPLPLPLLRSFLTLAIVTVVVGWGPLALMANVLPVVVEAVYVAMGVALFALAIRGLAKARRGDTVERSWPSLRRREGAGPHRPFGSPMEAQVWIECRRNGFGLPVMSAFTALFYVFPTILAQSRPPTVLGSLEYNATYPMYLVMPIFIATMSGFDGGCGSVADNFRPDFSLVPVLATRPLSDAGLVEAKLRMAVWSVLRSGAILAIGPLLLLLSPLRASGAPTTVVAYLVTHATLRGVGLALLAPLFLGAFAWRGIACAMWLRLSHRKWLRNGVGVALPTFVLMGAPFVWLHCGEDPQFAAALVHAVPFALGAIAALKLVAAFFVTRQTLALRLVPQRTVVRWGTACLALGVSLFLALRLLLPTLPLPPTQLALGVFLLLPLVRVQLAVLVMHDNRHR